MAPRRGRARKRTSKNRSRRHRARVQDEIYTAVNLATKMLYRALAAYPVGSKNHQVLLNAIYQLTVNWSGADADPATE